MSPAAASALQALDVNPLQLLNRHLCGDWGEASPVDVRQNELGVRMGLRITSTYVLPAGTDAYGAPKTVTVVILTRADRRATLVQLQGEH